MSLGFGQILIILLIILILFGAGKLPAVMKDLAKGVKSFKEGLNDDDEEITPALQQKKTSSEIRRQSPVKKAS